MQRAAARVLAVLLLLPACGDDTAGGGGSGGAGGSPEDGAGAATASGTGGDASATSGGSAGGPAGGGGDGDGGAVATGSAAGGGGAGTGGEAPVTADVHLIGRTQATDGGPRWSWSNTTIRTRVDGAALSVGLDGPSGIWFQVVVDGAPLETFVTPGGAYAQRIDLPSAGVHDVEVVRRNEGFFGGVTLSAVTAEDGGALVPTPARTRRLEFVGDSLTAGYGVECATAQENFSAATESSWAAYAAVAARELDADAHVIAYSGKGMIQNYGGDTTEPMPELFPRTITSEAGSTWDFAAWTPHAVVVNLGTNDFSAPIDEAAFVDGYATFLGELRAIYPDAALVAVTWAHWGASDEALVTEAVAATGDGNTTTTRFTILPEEGLGCDYHTNVVTNARLGAELAATLRTTLGW